MPEMTMLTKCQARQFLLLKHGLLGEYKFSGKQGILEYIQQTGCIQFDPIDACGKNAELVLQSRIKGFTKQMLYEMLYEDRTLVDYLDKNLSILLTEDWPYFERYREKARVGGLRFEGVAELEEQAKSYMKLNGPVNSNELELPGTIHWRSSIHWSGSSGGRNSAARAVLEQLYSTGECVIHHKKGTRKHYDLAENHLSDVLLNAPDPLPDELEHQKWRVLRRIGAVGLLWNRGSDALLSIQNLKSPRRKEVFQALLAEGKIFEVKVEEVQDLLFCRSEDRLLLEKVLQNEEFAPRCEIIAALDCMIWDRKLISALFGFDYTWEIYTPAEKRKYGYYVLPLLYGDSFIGRIEAVADKKENTLRIKNIWYEVTFKKTEEVEIAMEECIKRFAVFNQCNKISYENLE